MLTLKCLVTGGAGYIGTHTLIALIEAGLQPVVVDDFRNGSIENIVHAESITGEKIKYYNCNILDRGLHDIFKEEKFDIVLHFAALKSVAESIIHPLDYFENNISGFINLLKNMESVGVKKLVFSSSAAIYSDKAIAPFSENAPVKPVTPYGQTKRIGEKICEDLVNSGAGWQIVSLRYFNPAGAHKSGVIGDKPKFAPTNLFPVLGEVVTGRRTHVDLFGLDYDTKDGSAVRDYIHVMDLSEGHVAAIEWLLRDSINDGSFNIFNLGTGIGTTVCEIIDTYIEISKTKIPIKKCSRRAGDLPIVYANPKRAFDILGWKARRSLTEMVAHDWNFRIRDL